MGITGALSIIYNFKAANLLAREGAISRALNLPHTNFNQPGIKSSRIAEIGLTVKTAGLYFPYETFRRLNDTSIGKLATATGVTLGINNLVCSHASYDAFDFVNNNLGWITGIGVAGLGALGTKLWQHGKEIKQLNKPWEATVAALMSDIGTLRDESIKPLEEKLKKSLGKFDRTVKTINETTRALYHFSPEKKAEFIRSLPIEGLLYGQPDNLGNLLMPLPAETAEFILGIPDLLTNRDVQSKLQNFIFPRHGTEEERALARDLYVSSANRIRKGALIEFPEYRAEAVWNSLLSQRYLVETIAKSKIPTGQFDETKHLFVDPNTDILVFRPDTPDMTERKISSCKIPEDTKTILRQALDKKGVVEPGLFDRDARDFRMGIGFVSRDNFSDAKIWKNSCIEIWKNLNGQGYIRVVVTKSSFSKLGDKQNQVWESLINSGYIDRNGIIQPKFDGERKNFKVPEAFKKVKDNIFDVLQQAVNKNGITQPKFDGKRENFKMPEAFQEDEDKIFNVLQKACTELNLNVFNILLNYPQQVIKSIWWGKHADRILTPENLAQWDPKIPESKDK